MSMHMKMFGIAIALAGLLFAYDARTVILSALDGGSFFSSAMIRLIAGVVAMPLGTFIAILGFRIQDKEERESTDQHAS